MDTQFHSDLSWRGLIQDQSEGVVAKLKDLEYSVYCGFDATANSLTVGHLLPLITLMRFSQRGIPAIALICVTTASIGDPSFRTSDRPALDTREAEQNFCLIREQILNIARGEGAPVGGSFSIASNRNVANMSLMDFMRYFGRLGNVNEMIRRSSVQDRLESGMNFAELSYSLLQAR